MIPTGLGHQIHADALIEGHESSTWQKGEVLCLRRSALSTGFSEGAGDRGTGERADQGCQGLAALPGAGPGKRERRVAPDRHHAQSVEVIPVQAITARGGNGNGVRNQSGLQGMQRKEPIELAAAAQDGSLDPSGHGRAEAWCSAGGNGQQTHSAGVGDREAVSIFGATWGGPVGLMLVY